VTIAVFLFLLAAVVVVFGLVALLLWSGKQLIKPSVRIEWKKVWPQAVAEFKRVGRARAGDK